MAQSKARTSPPRYAPPGKVVLAHHPALAPPASQLLAGERDAPVVYVPDGSGGMRPINPAMLATMIPERAFSGAGQSGWNDLPPIYDTVSPRDYQLITPTPRPDEYPPPPEECEGGMRHAWDAIGITDGMLTERCKFCSAVQMRPAPEGMTLGSPQGEGGNRPAWAGAAQAFAPKRIAVVVRVAIGEESKAYTLAAQVPGDLPPQASLQHVAALLGELARNVENPLYRPDTTNLDLGAHTSRALGIWQGVE